MDEHFWLAICFVIFVALVIRRVICTISSFLEKAQSLIKHEIESATTIFKSAEEELLSVQKKHKNLGSIINAIKEKSKEEIAYDLKVREDSFEKEIKIRNKQLDNMINIDLHNFKLWALQKIKQNLQSKIIIYFENNKDSGDKFTEEMLRK